MGQQKKVGAIHESPLSKLDLENESLKIRGLVLFDVYADWCEPCKILDPILDDVKQRMGNDFSIQKIDYDRHPELAEQYHIKSVPTLMLFRNGKLLWRMAGFDTADKLEKIIRAQL